MMFYTNWSHPFKGIILKVIYIVCICIISYKFITMIFYDKNLDFMVPNSWISKSKLLQLVRSGRVADDEIKIHNSKRDEIIDGRGKINAKDSMSSPRLLKYIRKNVLEPPGSLLLPLSLINTTIRYNGQIGQDRIVEQIFNGKKNGFFIEAGAQDGENLSNTLFFERYLNWTGLLIEPSDSYYKRLKDKNRRCYIAHTCLSTKTYPIRIEFNGNQIFEPGTLLSKQEAIADVQCYPLYSLLLAMEPPVIRVDYLSLDVDGPELQILLTIPWDKLLIGVLSVEVRHNPFPIDKNTRNSIVNLITGHGFHYFDHYFDIIFIRDDMVYDRNAVKLVADHRWLN